MELAVLIRTATRTLTVGTWIGGGPQSSPKFATELANGYNGYLPTPEQHALGGYETWRAKSSLFVVIAISTSRRPTFLKNLRNLRARSPRVGHPVAKRFDA